MTFQFVEDAGGFKAVSGHLPPPTCNRLVEFKHIIWTARRLIAHGPICGRPLRGPLNGRGKTKTDCQRENAPKTYCWNNATECAVFKLMHDDLDIKRGDSKSEQQAGDFDGPSFLFVADDG